MEADVESEVEDHNPRANVNTGEGDDGGKGKGIRKSPDGPEGGLAIPFPLPAISSVTTTTKHTTTCQTALK